jgi:hypothetical protein
MLNPDVSLHLTSRQDLSQKTKLQSGGFNSCLYVRVLIVIVSNG